MAYIKMKKEKRERDNCVSCGEETEYYKDTHFNFKFYENQKYRHYSPC